MTASDQTPLAFMLSYVRQHRFAVLLVALLLLFVYGPFVELFAPRLKPMVSRVAIGVAFTLLLLAAVFTVTNKGRSFWTALWFAVPAIILELCDVVLFRVETHVASHLLSAFFLSYVILVLLKFIFESERVTTNTIFASLCVYLLLGTLWALAYSVLETFQPGAFHYSLAAGDTRGAMRLGSATAGLEFYFSFVTMTTLGYGDIVPVSSAARALVTLQAVVGQLYLTVLVARIVGLHVADSVSRRKR